MRRTFVIILFIGLLQFTSSAVNAYDDVAVEIAISNGLSVLQTEQDITEGNWGSEEGLEYINTVAAVEALRSTNQRNNVYYNGVAWLENHNSANADLTSRKIIELIRRGNVVTSDVAYLLSAKSDDSQSGWGLSAGYYSSVLDSALVLRALDSVEDSSDQSAVITYLLSMQNSDGGWSTEHSNASDYWFTAEVVIALALHQSINGVPSALTQASAFLGTLPQTTTSSTLARVTLALFLLNGLDATVDSNVVTLLSQQAASGDWGDVLASSNAITTLSLISGLNQSDGQQRAILEDEKLRVLLNELLGHSSYSFINTSELQAITVLDLRNRDINSLQGLENASNFTEIIINKPIPENFLENFSNVSVTIDDDTSPVITVPADIVTTADSSGKATVNIGEATATDVFDVVISNNAPSIFPVGVTVVTWIAEDQNNNVASAQQTITVNSFIDAVPPIVNAPQNIIVEATDILTVVALGDATATDNIDGVLIPIADLTGPFPIGNTTVTWSITDSAGNQGIAEQTVTVQDTTLPVLQVPQNIVHESATPDAVFIDIGQATATDIFDVTITNDAPASYSEGTTLVTWTATDENGNSQTNTQLVSVLLQNTQITNLAVGKLANQISVIHNGEPSRAVDGNTNGDWSGSSVTHTSNSEPNAWWEVDLGLHADIDHINVYKRTDACCSSRLSNFYVFISDTPFDDRSFEEIKNDGSIDQEFYEGVLGDPSVTFNLENVNGRYVRVQLSGQDYLYLAEVEVMGIAADPYISIQSISDQQTDIIWSAPVELQLAAISTSGNLLEYSSTTLPEGLFIDQYSGLITGQPTQVGTYPVVIEVNDGVATSSLSFSWVITENANSNLALGKVAKQISVNHNGVASRAVDGNTNGDWSGSSVTHTGNSEPNPWWEVDLGLHANIDHINIYKRTDACCSSRLSDFYVFISDMPFDGRSFEEIKNDGSIDQEFYAGVLGDPSVTFNLENVNGRYVRVQLSGQDYLYLAEVEVMGQ